MATCKIVVFFVFATLQLTFCLKPDKLDRDDSIHKHIHMKSLEKLGIHHFTKRSAQNRDSAVSCSGQNRTYESKLNSLTESNTFHESSTLLGDKHRILSLAFAFEDTLHIVVVTYGGDRFTQTSLYLSTDGGKTFKSHDAQIDNKPVQAHNGLQKHPRANKIFVLTSEVGRSRLCISNDGGIKFPETVVLPFPMLGQFIYHPTNIDYMLAVSHHNLWVTKDGGLEWNKIKEDVQNVKWSPDEDEESTIYASVSVAKDKFGDFLAIFGLETESFDNDLEVTGDLGSSWGKLHKHIYNFGIQGHFMFVSVFLDKEELVHNERVLEVSTDKGHTWNDVQLPSVAEDQFYSILDMSEGMIFIHVDTPGDTGEGTLYISDSTGIVYSESLTRHLYPNFEDVTDFYKVDSIRGVYMTSQLEEDNSIHTMITYDRGGEWRPITRPIGASCYDEFKACHLQIHNLFSRTKGVINFPPLSTENAPGIIMVHGEVAENSKTKEPDVFVSGDGGYTWRLALEGPHHYQIADQGALLIAVPVVQYPKTIKFSTDEGQCWNEYEFTKDDFNMTGLLVDPRNFGQRVAIWGNNETHDWLIHSFDFNQIVTATCADSDYEVWYPHWDLNTNSRDVDAEHRGCLLGKKEKMFRLKTDSWCLIKEHKQLSDKEAESCTCTKADYDCDYGYERVGSSEACVEDKMFKGPKLDICDRGHEMEIITKGYRRIPGDVCESTDDSYMHILGRKLIDLHKVCVIGDRSVLEEQVKDGYIMEESEPDTRNRTVGKALLLCVCVTLILIGLFLTAYFTRKRIIRRRMGRYRYSTLRTQDYGSDLQNAISTHTSLYDDSTDEENRADLPNNKDAPALSVNDPGLQNGGVSHFPPIKPPEMSSNQTPSFSNKERDIQSDDDLLGQVKSYHDDSDVDLLE